MSKLLIVGAGGHGCCCLEIANDYYDEIAFLDDIQVGKKVNDCKVIGTIEEMSSFYLEYENVFIAIGNNVLRKELSDKAKQIGYKVVSLVSNKSSISKYASIEEGCVIFPNVIINANACVKEGCIISSGAVIDHDALVEEYCHVNALAIVGSMAYVKAYTKIDYQEVYKKQENDEKWKEEYKKQFGREVSYF